MSDTEVTPAKADDPDPIPTELYTWGLSGRPLRMAFEDFQSLVGATRMANVGEMTAADIQPMLDEQFPDADYAATDLVIDHPPVGTFTFVDGDADTPTKFTATDIDLDLPDDLIRWDFGDDTQGFGPEVEHQYGAADDYIVTCRVAVAGRFYGSQQVYRHLGGPLPAIAVIAPRSAIVGSTRKSNVRVVGSNFDESTVIVFDGADVATTFVSENEVVTLVDPKLVTILGTVPVAVRQDGRLSNVRGFDFVPGPPLGVSAQLEPVEQEYDPGGHTVDEVVTYADKNPDQVDSLIGQEEVGKARVTLLEKLHAMNDEP